MNAKAVIIASGNFCYKTRHYNIQYYSIAWIRKEKPHDGIWARALLLNAYQSTKLSLHHSPGLLSVVSSAFPSPLKIFNLWTCLPSTVGDLINFFKSFLLSTTSSMSEDIRLRMDFKHCRSIVSVLSVSSRLSSVKSVGEVVQLN